MEPRVAEPPTLALDPRTRPDPRLRAALRGATPPVRPFLRALPWLLLLVTAAVISIAFWPGRMNADTLNEIYSAKTGIYTNQYCPILEALWHPFFGLGFGPGEVLAGQLLLFMASAFLLLRHTFKPIGAALAVCVICLTPEALGELGLVGRDTWFLAFIVACFACTTEVFATHGRRRLGWAAGAIVFAWLTLASRQNAATSVFVPLSLLAGLWLTHRRRHIGRKSLVVQAVTAGILVTLLMMGTQSLLNRALDVQNTNSIGQLYLYDLSNMSRINRQDYIPKSVYPGGSTQSLDTLTNIVSSLALISGPNHPIPYPFTPAVGHALLHRWEHEIESHPFTYLRERVHQMLYTLGLGEDQIWIYHPYIDANPFGYTTTFPWADNIANHYEQAFTTPANNGGLLFTPWIFLLICCVAAAVSLRRYSPRRLIVGSLAIAAVTYQVGLFFGLMGPNYRYEFPCIVIAEIVMAVALHECWQRARTRVVLPSTASNATT
jgi:hypothetical protein